MLPNLVTLCLLITYHWHGSKADSTWVRSAMSESVRPGIAGEVNGSPTYARLNIPVVKRSSNQAAFANELRPAIVVERANDPSPNLFVAPRREYANHNRDKYIPTNIVVVKKFVEPFSRFTENLQTFPTNHETVKERKFRRKIELSILRKNVFALNRLIGKTNFSRTTLNRDRWFRRDADSKSTMELANARINVKNLKNVDDASMTSMTKKRCEKSMVKNAKLKKSVTIVDCVFVKDVGDTSVRGIRREDIIDGRTEKKEIHLLGFGIEKIGNETTKQRERKKRSSSSLSSLSPIERDTFERSKHGFIGETDRFVGYKRLHQQSRNTEPRTIIQHRQRNAKRHTVYDKNGYSRISNKFVGNRRSNDRQTDTASSTKDRDDQLRFVPADLNRPDNTIYFRRILKPLTTVGASENDRDRQTVLPFPSGDLTDSSKIFKFDDEQIATFRDTFKGVFDNYEMGPRERLNILPNVRTIRPERIFLTPPRLIDDSKILPADAPLMTYFENPLNVPVSDPNNENPLKIVNLDNVSKNVFERNHDRAEVDHGFVIPVRDDGPSMTESGNFVTPQPDEGIRNGNEVSSRVNRPNSETNVDYVISRESVNPGFTESTNESQRNVDREISRPNQESTVESEIHRNFGANAVADGRGLSYDDSSVASDNHGQIGSTDDFDHSVVIDGTDDEYAIPTSEIRDDGLSYVVTHNDTDDSGSHKWRDNDERNRYAANYSFGYRVSDGETKNEFGHQETREGGITNGRYHVKLPDGRLQKVNYHVDEDGYHASVTYHNRR